MDANNITIIVEDGLISCSSDRQLRVAELLDGQAHRCEDRGADFAPVRIALLSSAVGRTSQGIRT